MKKSTIGFLVLILIGIGGLLAWKKLMPVLFKQQQEATSDAVKGVPLRIGGDNYLGYWFITSQEMRKQAVRKGFHVDFTDDGGLYAERLDKFARGEYDCIVLPVNSYLEQGAAHKFPGVIVAAISESKGADGVVAFADKLPSGKINDLNDPSLRFVYTADSPSSFLLDLTITDFDLDQLHNDGGIRIKAEGSADVLAKAKAGEGDVFVLWEPDLSKALTLPGMKYVWGSDRFSGYIVDVFVFNRDFLASNKKVVSDFLTTYFRVMGLYANNRDNMLEEMARSSHIKKEAVAEITAKIEWFDLAENSRLQFGITTNPGGSAEEGIVNTIIGCTDVLLRNGRLQNDPLAGNPYLITNSSFLESLSKNNVLARSTGAPKKRTFAELEPDAWSLLNEIGTFRIEPITFQSWDNRLTEEGKARVDKIAGLLTNNYPGYRVIIRGHTGPGGDESENRKLSQERSDLVRQYLIAVHGIGSQRILAQGVGSQKPPRKKPGESPRAYRYRLPRVEFIAVEENRL